MTIEQMKLDLASRIYQQKLLLVPTGQDPTKTVMAALAKEAMTEASVFYQVANEIWGLPLREAS